MIRKKIIFIILIILVSVSRVSAQFYSENLQTLYNSLPQSLRLDSVGCDTVVFKNYIIENDTAKIVYQIDKNCFMTHCGFRFFNEIETLPFGKNVAKFIERELLNLIITNNVQTLLHDWDEKKVFFRYNENFMSNDFFKDKQQLVKIFNNASNLNIEKNEEYFLSTIICADSNICQFALPINEDLISGMDKKERDDLLAEQLKTFKAKQNYIKELDDHFLKILKDSLYVYEGSYYMIPEINNNLYLQKKDSALSIITSKEYAEETFVNSILLQTNKNYTINIKHKKYGQVFDNYTVFSSDFFNFFYDDFDNFFGIEEYNENTGQLTGTLILRNKETESIHLGYVTCNIEDLLQEGNISIELRSNIPQKNILNLFGEDEK